MKLRTRTAIVFLTAQISLLGLGARVLADCLAPTNAYVRSVEALIVHERIHAMNVQELMMRHAIAHPEIYRAAYPYIASYARFHDIQKRESHIAKILCELWGTNLELTDTLSPARRAEVQYHRTRLIDFLNEHEKALVREALAGEMGLTDAAGKPLNRTSETIIALLTELEEIADTAERVANPISPEELGKPRMDVDHSVNRYVGRHALRGRALAMRREARELIEFYQKNQRHFAGYSEALRLGNDTQIGVALNAAQARLDWAETQLAQARPRSIAECPHRFRRVLRRARTF